MDHISPSDVNASRSNAIQHPSSTPSLIPSDRGGPSLQPPRTYSDAPVMSETRRALVEPSSRLRPPSSASTNRYSGELSSRQPPSPIGSGTISHNPRDSQSPSPIGMGMGPFRLSPTSGDLRDPDSQSPQRPSTLDYTAPFLGEDGSSRRWGQTNSSMEIGGYDERRAPRQSAELSTTRQLDDLMYNDVLKSKLIPLMIG